MLPRVVRFVSFLKSKKSNICDTQNNLETLFAFYFRSISLRICQDYGIAGSKYRNSLATKEKVLSTNSKKVIS